MIYIRNLIWNLSNYSTVPSFVIAFGLGYMEDVLLEFVETQLSESHMELEE
jgi:hypothetical protein